MENREQDGRTAQCWPILGLLPSGDKSISGTVPGAMSGAVSGLVGMAPLPGPGSSRPEETGLFWLCSSGCSFVFNTFSALFLPERSADPLFSISSRLCSFQKEALILCFQYLLGFVPSKKKR
jgi:hypothetical protein